EPLERGILCFDDTRKLPRPRMTVGDHREVADRQVMPAQHAARPAEGEQLFLEPHGHRTGLLHTGAASSGSESEPPGTIIGKTFASCSITSSTSAGPGAAFACRNASVTSPACRTRHPGMPYASASFT